MQRLLTLGLIVLALPACAGYGPADPASRRGQAPAPAVTVVPPITDDAGRAEPPADAAAYLASRGLLIPVAGIAPTGLRDSFAAGRDGGARQHNAIDIMAPRGTAVLAADDGRVLRLANSALGGISLYAVDPGGRLVYYYAHLDAYHPRLAEGMPLARGDTLGYVGSTGNASATAPHLHFQVMRMPADPRRYWDGDPINPFPVLLATGPQGTPAVQGAPVSQAGEERP